MGLRNIGIWFAATRPAFLSVTLVAVMLGLSTATYDNVFHAPILAAMTLVFALVAHAGANVINDYYDALSGCDAANVDRIFPFTGGSRFIQEGVLTPHLTAVFGYALLVMVIPAGLYLVKASASGLLAIGLCGLFAGWAYSSKPLCLQSRGVGEITITIAWMMVVMGTDYVQRDSFAWTPIISGFAYALLVANVLFINQVPDRKADEATGKRTLIVRLGVGIAPAGSSLLYLMAGLSILFGIVTGYLPTTAALTLLVSAPATCAIYKLSAGLNDKTALTVAIRLTIISTLLFGAFLSLALISS